MFVWVGEVLVLGWVRLLLGSSAGWERRGIGFVCFLYCSVRLLRQVGGREAELGRTKRMSEMGKVRRERKRRERH